MTADVEAIDLCAGPGGWDEGARLLDPDLHARIVGIEWDEAACLTREAAGHRTVKADIAQVIPLTFRGCRGLIASPPCTLFSQAGSGVGRELVDLLADAIWRILHGDDCREQVREAVYPTCLAAQTERNAKRVERGKASWTDEQLAKAARDDAYIACLVLEPARYVHDLDESLEWLAFEQVPSVLPLWRIYATALRKLGWSAWAGVLNAADYGVPQTRERAILIARRPGPATPPEATHTEGGSHEDLFGVALPTWVSMAEALGWGMTRRPATTLPATTLGPDGKPSGGPRALDGGSGAREMVRREYESGHWAGRKLPWLDRPEDAELVVGDHRPNGTARPVSEPAPTLHFGNAAANVTWREGAAEAVPDETQKRYLLGAGQGGAGRPRPVDEPAPTLTGKDTAAWATEPDAWYGQGSVPWADRVNDQTGTEVDLTWPEDRPATTIATRPLVPHPGPNNNRFNTATKSRNDGLRITEAEAAVLQSFRPDYPWQGNRTAIFRQIGDAMPPQLAAHVIAAALGRAYAGDEA